MINIKEYAILCDFDGTITCEDSNDLLFRIHGNHVNAQIEKDFQEGLLGTRDAMEQHFAAMNITMDTYLSFLENNIHIEPDFARFVDKV